MKKAGQVRYWQYGLAGNSPNLAKSDPSRFVPQSEAYFSGSITLLGLELVDQNGNVIPATFTSDQGFNYLDVGSLSVPEPPSLVAWGMAALGLLAWRLASPGGANGDGGAGRGRG